MWWMCGYWGITDFEIYMVYCPMKGVYNRVAVGLTKLCQIMKSVIRILQYYRNLDYCFFKRAIKKHEFRGKNNRLIFNH